MSKTPLHIRLQQFRVLYIIVTLFFLWLGYDAWEWFKDANGGLSEAAAAGFVSIYLAVIGVLKFVMENVRHDNKHDDRKD